MLPVDPLGYLVVVVVVEVYVEAPPRKVQVGQGRHQGQYVLGYGVVQHGQFVDHSDFPLALPEFNRALRQARQTLVRVYPEVPVLALVPTRHQHGVKQGDRGPTAIPRAHLHDADGVVTWCYQGPRHGD